MRQTVIKVSQRTVERTITEYGLQKKLYKFRPKDKKQKVEAHYTKETKKTVSVNSLSVERQVRQMLAEKISGTYVGLWLLLPEHLRLGTWDSLGA